MSGKVHKYFERKASEWNIVAFLYECELEPCERKIDCYLSSLENIDNGENDSKSIKAQLLLARYREVSMSFLLKNVRIESGWERRWPSRLSDVQAVLERR